MYCHFVEDYGEKVDVQTMVEVNRRTGGVPAGAGGQQADFG